MENILSFSRTLDISRKISAKRRLTPQEINEADNVKTINELLLHAQDPVENSGLESWFAERLRVKRAKIMLKESKGSTPWGDLLIDLFDLHQKVRVQGHLMKEPEIYLLAGEIFMETRAKTRAQSCADHGLLMVDEAIKDNISTSGEETKTIGGLKETKCRLLGLKEKLKNSEPVAPFQKVTHKLIECEVEEHLCTENNASPHIVYPLSHSGKQVYNVVCEVDLEPGMILGSGMRNPFTRFPRGSFGARVCHHCLKSIQDFVVPCKW